MKKSVRAMSADIKKEVVMCEVDETTCGVCYAEFLDVEDLKLHIEQIHSSGKLISCHFCDHSLSDDESYALHIRDIHLLDFRACWACTRVFTDSSQFRKHEIKHPRSMREGTFSCSQCKEFVLNKYDLRQHERENHYDTTQGAFLDKYYALLTSVINIKAETLIQSSGKDLVYTCSACNFSSTDLEEYVSHLKTNNCRSCVCDWCSTLCKRKSDLAFHIKQHMKGKIDEQIHIKSKMKQCLKCKEYYQKSIVNHRCSRNLKCSQCDMVFKTMYELSEHQPKAHPISVALQVCKFCRKECVGSEALEKHMERAHNHELHLYKYTCSYCDTTFKHPQRLFAHYFLKHKELNPYLCKICDKPFRIRKAFTLHIKIQHKSEGFVEFDEKLHVFFTDKKSEKPFQPVSKYASEIPIQASTSNEGKSKVANMSHKSKDLQRINMDSDVDLTGKEGNGNNEKKTRRKRKKDDIDEVMVLSDYDSDDEPLVVVKKKAKLKSQLKRRPLLWKRKPTKKISKSQFTCKICKKYCYTFQNYQNHVNMHFRDEAKKCIKCTLTFKSKEDLQLHMTEQHSSSQLTETLKNILERRKKGEQNQEMSTTMKFLNTIKKVQIDKHEVTATLNPITKEMSVQKFIENFTPEGGPTKNIDVKHSITITKVKLPIEREPVIKMTKFKPQPANEGVIKLAMPIKFKRCNEQHGVSVRRVQTDGVHSKLNFTYDENQFNQYDDDNNDDNDYYQDETKESIIPEAEREVTLGAEDAPKKAAATHKIVIPKLPKELKSIRIAHLLAEAPYYKIVKVADIIKDQDEKQHKPKEAENTENEAVDTDVRLPDGTKLVHVNPLAHLLGNTSVEKIVKSSSKYYKPKSRNFEAVMAKALRKLEEAPKKQKKKKGEKLESKEAIADKGNASDDINSVDAVNDETHTELAEESVSESTESVPLI